MTSEAPMESLVYFFFFFIKCLSQRRRCPGIFTKRDFLALGIVYTLSTLLYSRANLRQIDFEMLSFKVRSLSNYVWLKKEQFVSVNLFGIISFICLTCDLIWLISTRVLMQRWLAVF